MIEKLCMSGELKITLREQLLLSYQNSGKPFQYLSIFISDGSTVAMNIILKQRIANIQKCYTPFYVLYLSKERYSTNLILN